MKRKRDADVFQQRNANLETAYIYRLPNELLSLIFTFLFLFENALCPIRSNLKTPIYVKPHLVVRWISVWFRKIASQHIFWLGGDLDISQFLSNNRSNNSIWDEKPQPFPPNGCLAILLNDSDLRNCLFQRSRWNFQQPNDLVEVLEKEPSFFRNTQCLSLRYCQDHIPLRTLGLLVSLTRLDIDTMDPLNLDAIAKFCPFLKILELELRHDEFEGSLAPLQNITVLDIFMVFLSNARDSRPFSSLLPLRSANVLTRLSLYLPSNLAISFRSITSNPFDAFVTLTDLAILIFNAPLFELIADTRITSIVKLTLGLIVYERDTESALSIIPRLMSAPSLKGLRRLILHGDTSPSDYRYRGYKLIDPTTLAGLHCLEYLDLHFPVPSAWWSHFGSLGNLEFLDVWIDLEEE